MESLQVAQSLVEDIFFTATIVKEEESEDSEEDTEDEESEKENMEVRKLKIFLFLSHI